MNLLKGQKNELFELIKKNGLEPFNFKWDERVESSVLRYRDTSYYFSIEIIQNRFRCSRSPGDDIINEQKDMGIWAAVAICFGDWLKFVKNEISQPDLWGELEKIKLFDVVSYEDNTELESESIMQEFTYREVLQIEQGINDIRKYLLEEVEVNTQEIKIVNEKLDYLIDANKRMGRVDWKNIFIGVIIDLIIAIGLDPVQRQVVGQLIQNTVSGIIQLLPFK